jgi:hypothetical protein
MSIISQIEQYGFINSFNRTIKLILRKFGIQIETYIVYKQTINLSILKRVKIEPKYTIKRLYYNDYKNSKGLIFDDSKLKIFENRLEGPFYKAYGVFDEDVLIYSTWISTKKLEFSLTKIGLELDSTEGLLLDILTHPEYRKQGLHNYMNIFCLERIKELGKDRAVVLVIIENIPARKSQERSGFVKSKIVNSYKLWKMEGIKIKNI